MGGRYFADQPRSVLPTVFRAGFCRKACRRPGDPRSLAGILPVTADGQLLAKLRGSDLTSHGQFYQQSFGQDFAEKLAGGQETHGAWPGYYLLLLTVSFWPSSVGQI